MSPFNFQHEMMNIDIHYSEIYFFLQKSHAKSKIPEKNVNI